MSLKNTKMLSKNVGEYLRNDVLPCYNDFTLLRKFVNKILDQGIRSGKIYYI